MIQKVIAAVVLVFVAGCKQQRTFIECSADFVCPSGLYCGLGEKCGGIDRKGICMPQPTTCPVEDKLVCGCDGKDYPSTCYANASGITVDYPGRCMRSVPR